MTDSIYCYWFTDGGVFQLTKCLETPYFTFSSQLKEADVIMPIWHIRDGRSKKVGTHPPSAWGPTLLPCKGNTWESP